MTTTKPSQNDHFQHAIDVLEAENAELRQTATVLMLQIQGLRGGQQSNALRDSAEPVQRGNRHESQDGPGIVEDQQAARRAVTARGPGR
jgi:hypothetical protein